jgi:hypothetical protein
LTIEPAESADEAVAFADALLFALTDVAVTSPLRIAIVEISADALAVAEGPGEAKAPDVTEPTLTTEPSAGYA